MSGIDNSGIDSNDTQSQTRTLTAVLIVLLLLSPGFLMIFAETSGLNSIAALAMWALLLAVVVLLVRQRRFTRNTAGMSDITDDDDGILSRMYRHASRARRTGDPGKFYCSYCETLFDLLNAVPVERDVFLCPGCGTRLMLE